MCEYFYLNSRTNTTKKIQGKTREKNQVKILSCEKDFFGMQVESTVVRMFMFVDTTGDTQ